MTTSEVEAWLKDTYPDKHFTVSDKLGIGLPMLDGVLLYVKPSGPKLWRPALDSESLDKLAEQLIAMAEGKQIP